MYFISAFSRLRFIVQTKEMCIVNCGDFSESHCRPDTIMSMLKKRSFIECMDNKGPNQYSQRTVQGSAV